MKRYLVLLLVAAVVFGSVAFAQSAADYSAMTDEELIEMRDSIDAELLRRENEAKDAAKAQIPEGEVYIERKENGGYKIVYPSEEVLKASLRKVTVTTENWNEYMSDLTYTRFSVSKNNFGEVTRDYEQRYVGFGFKDGYVGYFEEVGLKMTGKKKYENRVEWSEDDITARIVDEKWTDVNEECTFDLNGCRMGVYNAHLEDYECVAAVGTIYLLEVPEEISEKQATDEIGWADVYVGDKDYGDTDGVRGIYERLHGE